MANVIKTYAVRDSATELKTTAGVETQTIPCDTMDEKTAFIVTNISWEEDAIVTVVAGNGIRSSIGDLVVKVPAGAEYIIGPLDSMRFKDMTTGNVTVRISGGVTKIKPFSL